jgi:hypothetical protein
MWRPVILQFIPYGRWLGFMSRKYGGCLEVWEKGRFHLSKKGGTSARRGLMAGQILFTFIRKGLAALGWGLLAGQGQWSVAGLAG